MKEVRLGIIGVGGMGNNHVKSASGLSRCKLTAVCDMAKETADKVASQNGSKAFYDASEMIRSKEVDAILIATPHYFHTPIAIEALKNKVHVLCEKPVGVHKADVQKMIDAHTDPSVKFAAMFNVRTTPVYRKVRDMIQRGDLGELRRVNWIITTWFRSQAYYDGGAWRATWAGEGGGVLLNQCPHQLDLFQWLVGMPTRVHGHCHIAKYHNIEVEDEVTAYLEYANGCTGVFITSTGEAPGTNRLEIVGDWGRLTVENDRIHFLRNEIRTDEYCKTTKQRFATPPVWDITVPAPGKGGAHFEIMQNFVNSILDDTPLLAPAEEGMHSVELGNAMLLSSLLGKPVDIPMDAGVFEKKLQELIKNSKFKKKTVKTKGEVDMSASFVH